MHGHFVAPKPEDENKEQKVTIVKNPWEKSSSSQFELNIQLFTAVRLGSIKKVTQLLSQGADIEARDLGTTLTALGVAIVEKNDPAMVEHLLANKANPETPTVENLGIYGHNLPVGSTVLDVALRCTQALRMKDPQEFDRFMSIIRQLDPYILKASSQYKKGGA